MVYYIQVDFCYASSVSCIAVPCSSAYFSNDLDTCHLRFWLFHRKRVLLPIHMFPNIDGLDYCCTTSGRHIDGVSWKRCLVFVAARWHECVLSPGDNCTDKQPAPASNRHEKLSRMPHGNWIPATVLLARQERGVMSIPGTGNPLVTLCGAGEVVCSVSFSIPGAQACTIHVVRVSLCKTLGPLGVTIS